MRDDQKNLFMAMGLSLLVIIGWNYFYGVPEAQRQRQTQQQAQTTPPAALPQTSTATPGATPGATAPGAAPSTPAPATGAAPAPAAVPGAPAPAPLAIQGASREQALAGVPRVRIDTPSLTGSINLRGGRIDDVRLRNYRETIQPGSPTITLLNPAGGPNPYFVESGFVAQPGSNIAAPRPDTVWTADRETLSLNQPVTLTWDNGQGLVFRRIISVDENFMFTVRNVIDNKTEQAVTLFPYALTSRTGKPRTEGYVVLHEGFVGVVGDSRVQEYTYDNVEKEPKQTRLFKGTGGWVGITDKYWATAVIPEQNVAFEARYTAQGPATARTYQSDFLEEGRTVAPGASVEATHRIFAGAKETQIIDGYKESLQVKNFDLMIDWGWFYFITKPLFWLHPLHLPVRRQFRRRDPHRDRAHQARLLPARQSQLRVDGEDEGRAARDEGAAGALQGRQAGAAEGDDGALQAREGQSRRGLSADAGADPGVLRALQGDVRHHRDAARAVLRLDPRPVRARPDEPVQPVRPAAVRSDSHPGDRRLPVVGIWPLLMGVTMFLQMKMNPEPTDPDPEGDVRLDAGDLHLHARRVPGGPRDLLDLEQHPVRVAAVLHHAAAGR